MQMFSYLRSSYSNKKCLSETFFLFVYLCPLARVSYGGFDFIAELRRY